MVHTKNAMMAWMVSVAMALTAACGGSSGRSSGNDTHAQPGGNDTPGGGRTLYAFASDTVGTPTTPPVSACATAQCSESWPSFLTDQVTVPSGLAATDFTVFTRSDGLRQSAYQGHPLYYYAGDVAPGDTNGRGVPGWKTLDPKAP